MVSLLTEKDSLKSEEQTKGSAMTKRGIWAAVSYMASAAGEPHNIGYNPAAFVTFRTLVHTLLLALSYLLYMLVTTEAVSGINVPMYTTLRRTTVAFTLIVDYLLTGQKHSFPVVSSVGIIMLGAFLAGAWDLSCDAYGYAVVFTANICTAVNPVASIALALCDAMVAMLLSCIMVFLINYCVFLNTTLNSALTQTICGNLKDLFTTELGWLLFAGLPFVCSMSLTNLLVF